MVSRIAAYKSATGRVFPTEEEAHNDEMNDAVETLLSSEKSHLKNIVAGYSSCTKTREAIILLARTIQGCQIVDARGPERIVGMDWELSEETRKQLAEIESHIVR